MTNLLKRLFPVFIFASSFFIVHAAGDIQSRVEQWNVFEIALNGPTNGNPFLDVQLSARFTNNTTNAVEVDGFYDGDGVYRVRFMPDRQGEWHCTTASSAPELNGKTGEFTVIPPSGNNHGPVGVTNTYHFAYADGGPFHLLGTTSYGWTHQVDAQEELTLRTLAASPFNKVRMCVFPTSESWNRGDQPNSYPFAGGPTNFDFTRFNPLFFQHLEKRVGNLRNLGIEADVILFHPYDKGRWGFDRMDAATDDRYVRYVVARLAAYRNVWWSLANEYDLMRQKQESDWDRIFQLIQNTDPYHHLRSVHNSMTIYNNSLPWVTHASIQNGSAVEDAGRAELYRDVWRKPVVFDEVKYEGDFPQRWGQLSAEEMVHRFWEGLVAGTYVGHGECYQHPPDNFVWISQGGVLRGQSPVRLAFLKKVMDDGPDEIDPIDKWQYPNIGGQAGDYYLIYFGKQQPTNWVFELPKLKLSDGLKFKVEILDTWNMTITPVDGIFTAKKNGDYTFADADGRSVALPGRSWMALQIRRVPE
jgi:hypothetical protein